MVSVPDHQTLTWKKQMLDKLMMQITVYSCIFIDHVAGKYYIHRFGSVCTAPPPEPFDLQMLGDG